MHCLFQASPVTQRVWRHYYRGGNQTQKPAPGPPATKRGAGIGTGSPDLRAHCQSTSILPCHFTVKLHLNRVGSHCNSRVSYFLALLQSQISKPMEKPKFKQEPSPLEKPLVFFCSSPCSYQFSIYLFSAVPGNPSMGPGRAQKEPQLRPLLKDQASRHKLRTAPSGWP